MSPAAPVNETTGVTLMRDQLTQFREDSQRSFDRLDKRFDEQENRFNDWIEAYRLQREGDMQFRQAQYERFQQDFTRVTQADNDRKREIDQHKNQMDRFENEQKQTFKDFRDLVLNRFVEKDRQHSDDMKTLRSIFQESQQVILEKFIDKDAQHDAEILTLRKTVTDVQAQMSRIVWKVGLLVGGASGGLGFVANLMMQ